MKTVFPVDEGTTPEYQVNLLDFADVAIPDADLDTLKLTLYDRLTGTIINSRDDQNVLNANDVSVVNGLLTWQLQPADTAMHNSDREAEIRVALWEWTYSPSTETLLGKHETVMRLRNLTKV